MSQLRKAIEFWEDVTKEWTYQFVSPSIQAQVEWTIRELKRLETLDGKKEANHEKTNSIRPSRQ